MRAWWLGMAALQALNVAQGRKKCVMKVWFRRKQFQNTSVGSIPGYPYVRPSQRSNVRRIKRSPSQATSLLA